MRLASKKHISRVWLAQGAAASQCLVDPSRTSLWVIFGGFHNGGDKDDGGAVKLNVLQQHMLDSILSSPFVGDVDGVDVGPGQDVDHVVVEEGEPWVLVSEPELVSPATEGHS